ncbi:hypothetical protein [Spongiactinospora sp. TRM90649]|uniref:hypothetical protein n=1 Tax=Spongiactinospora sp. TRM90649 TaxID=3031114 RepID=UPI0023F9A164|nr:hypothetical protein [Spongiactinospora sp. TRM90649]MDF5754103.1 hypothetical protein [Spongiactinospora sp. TRM90649]
MAEEGQAVLAHPERFVRAAMLGSAMAAEIQRILRDHVKLTEVAPDGTILVEVPYPDSTVLYAVLDAAAACFGGEGPGEGSPEEARQAMVEPVLQLASLLPAQGGRAPSADNGWPEPPDVG